MHGGLAAAIARRPGTALVANVAVLAVAGLLAAGAPERIAIAGGWNDVGARWLSVVARGEPAIRTQPNRAAVAVVRSGIEADPGVARVTRVPERTTRRRVVLDVRLRPGSPTAVQEAAERIEGRIDPGPLAISVEGEAIRVAEDRERVREEAGRLGLLILPFALLVLALGFGARHAIAPLLAGLSGAVGGLAALRLLAEPLDLAGAAAIGVAVAVGLALGIEACAALRARALSSRLRDVHLGDRPAGRGRMLFAVVAGAGLAAIAGLIFGAPVARAAAVGGAAAAVAAIGSAAVAMPAMLALFPASPIGPTHGGRRDRFHLLDKRRRLTNVRGVGRSFAWILALASVAGLLAAAVPLLDPFDEPDLTNHFVGFAALVTLVSVSAAAVVTPFPGSALAHGIGGALPGVAAAGLLVTAGDGELPLGLGEELGEAELGAIVGTLVAVGAVAVGRGALADGRTAVTGTLVAAATLGVLVGSDVAGARQLGGAVAVGLLADLVVVRAVLVPAIKRGLAGGRSSPRDKRHRRSGTRRFRLPDRLRR